MSPLMLLMLSLIMVATAFLSGLFGMAGGMVLIGVLLAIMPLPAAMALHAITQMASNGWRALLWYGHIRWSIIGIYVLGALVALLAWSLTRYVPSKPLALIFLGVTPFLVRLMPASLQPDPESPKQSFIYGVVCMTLMLLTGVSGPLLDTFFLGGKLERREIIATKASCQLASHGMKLIYFGGIIDQGAALDPVLAGLAIAMSMLGTTLSKRVLDMMTDTQFRVWANRIITAIASWFLLQGSYLLLTQ